MKLQKNKKKTKAITTPTPAVQVELVQPNPNPIKDIAAARKPAPCVIFRENISIPNLEEHARMAEKMDQPKMAIATGYQEDGTLNISVEEQATFPDFMLKYSMQHGCEEAMDVLKAADDTVASTAITATRNVIFSSLTTKINHIIFTAMAQANKVIIDELEKYSPELRSKVATTVENSINSNYGMPCAVYNGDVSVGSNGGVHSLGNIIANCKPSDENVDAVKKSLSMWLDNYMIKAYDNIMQIIMQKIYSSSMDIIQADAIYSAIEEFACDVFKCYGTHIHNLLGDLTKDVIFAQMHAYPNAKVRGCRSYYIDDYDE